MAKVTFYGSRAKDWLKECLSHGSKNCEDVKYLARAEGFSKGELNRARKLLGVKTRRTDTDVWMWSLPQSNKEAVWRKQ